MSKRKLSIIVIIISSVLVICAVGIGIYFHRYCEVKKGYYLQCNGTSFIIEETDFYPEGAPIIMNPYNSNDKIFSELENGDRILAISDIGMDDSLPASIGVHFCIRLEKGTMDDIPKSAIEELTELGWIEEK